MKTVNLRLSLTSDVVARLTTLIVPNSKFRHFVRVKKVQHAGEIYEVDLNILDAYEVGPIDARGECIVVTREMVGELFDLLGIFPRSDDSFVPFALTEIEKSADFIRGLASKGHSGEQYVIEHAESIKDQCALIREKLGMPIEKRS